MMDPAFTTIPVMNPPLPTIEERARASAGASSNDIYSAVSKLLAEFRSDANGKLLDVGCGTGSLYLFVRAYCSLYVGLDVVRYEQLDSSLDFRAADLDAVTWPVEGEFADVTVAVETIEHLENPRAFFRELVRITKRGGIIIVTTPNQLSLLSKLALVVKNQFMAFQERPGLYPAHRTALLEIDLVRIARECGLTEIVTRFTNRGRIPGCSMHWPRGLGFRGRAFSDNVLLKAKRPDVA